MKLTAAEQRKLGIEPAKRSKPKTVVQEISPELFKASCAAHGLPVPESEFRFHESRKWRIDWFWADHWLALEIQGAIFSGGRHVRGPALLAEYSKLNEMAIAGIRTIFATPQQINDGSIFPILRRALKLEGD